MVEISFLSLYRIQPNNTNKRTKKTSNTNFDKNSQHEPDVKRLLLTSFDLKTTSKETSPEIKLVKSKNKLKGGGDIEIDDEHLDEILQNNNL